MTIQTFLVQPPWPITSVSSQRPISSQVLSAWRGNQFDLAFRAPNRSVVGTKLPIRDVCYPVATGGEPDIAPKARFGSDGPKPGILRPTQRRSNFGPRNGWRNRKRPPTGAA